MSRSRLVISYFFCVYRRQSRDVLFPFRTLDLRYFDRCNLALGTDLHWCPMAKRVLHVLQCRKRLTVRANRDTLHAARVNRTEFHVTCHRSRILSLVISCDFMVQRACEVPPSLAKKPFPFFRLFSLAFSLALLMVPPPASAPRPRNISPPRFGWLRAPRASSR